MCSLTDVDDLVGFLGDKRKYFPDRSQHCMLFADKTKSKRQNVDVTPKTLFVSKWRKVEISH